MNRNLSRREERGFTLIEILIALTIGLFLTGALLTIVQSNRRVYGEQNQMAQMQDNQRMALTMMADVIQSAGYFPNPVVNTLTGALPAAGPFGIGQSIYGTYSAAAPGDQIQVRFRTDGGDGVLNCSGQSNPNAPGSAGELTYVNSFQVVNGQLVCTMNGTNYALVGGIPGSRLDITTMAVLYGVKTNAAAPGNDVDTYMTGTQVNAAGLWGSVISVSVRLTFTNPLYAAGNGQLQTLDVQRTIGVMSQTGPVQ
ncbi:MAG: prepilin-type N-terminal cleavage/methylation domain-containing protein [Gammaproteobacteria bacterium]